MELSILRDYQQTPHKIMKNQGENKNRYNIFDSHEFIDCAYNFFLLSNQVGKLGKVFASDGSYGN